VIEAVMMNPLRTGLLTTLLEMGAALKFSTVAMKAARRSPICAFARGAQRRGCSSRARALDD